MTTAFVLSGGGSLGAVQVGMLAALEQRGFRPDLLVGTSVGALNAGTWERTGTTTSVVDRLPRSGAELRRADVFPFDPLRQTMAMAGRRQSLCSRRPLRRLVEANLELDDLRDARIPLHIVTTDVMSGEEVLLSSGDAVSAVLASSAIPAVFAPVRAGRHDVDGRRHRQQHGRLSGDRARRRPRRRAPAGFSCALAAPPTTPLAAATHALTLLIEQRLIVDVAYLADRADVIVLPPLCPLTVSAIDFRSADTLMSRAQQASGAWIDAGNHLLPHPERFLSMHGHRWAGTHHHKTHEEVA